jgi:hypothetical protein
MKNLWKYVIVSVAVIVSAIVLAMAYTEKHRSAAGTITVTGLGETEFTSDLIVIKGSISSQDRDASTSYVKMQSDRDLLVEFLVQRGVSADEITFSMPSTHPVETANYVNGEWAGYQFSHYNSVQPFVVESTNIDIVESASRELPSLIAEGVSISVYDPMYYFSKLDDVKLDLLSEAASDARERAQNIAASSGAKLGALKESRAGVFQITASTGDEEFSAGGSFNISSREKKARVTVRSVYEIEK